MNIERLIIAIALFAGSVAASGAGRMVLSLGDAVRLANDSSLNAFRNRNLYASGYWEWRTFKANRLPRHVARTDPCPILPLHHNAL